MGKDLGGEKAMVLEPEKGGVEGGQKEWAVVLGSISQRKRAYVQEKRERKKTA